MRIVTSDARDATVSIVSPTPALFQPIRLKSEAEQAEIRGHLHRHIRPGSVASSTEIHGIGGSEAAGVYDGRGSSLIVLRFGSGNMRGTRAVARFATETWSRFLRLEDTRCN
jgi:hypothetical protein